MYVTQERLVLQGLQFREANMVPRELEMCLDKILKRRISIHTPQSTMEVSAMWIKAMRFQKQGSLHFLFAILNGAVMVMVIFASLNPR